MVGDPLLRWRLQRTTRFRVIRLFGQCAALPFGSFFFSRRRRHTRFDFDWSSDVCSSDLPLTVGEKVGIPKGANVSIKLLDAATAGKMKRKSEIQIGLDSVEFQGKKYPLQSSTYEEAGKSQGKQTAKRVGIGAAVGTAVGAIAGGGKGAAIGAGIGAGAGV